MRQALDLNLATRPFRNNTLPWSGAIVGLAAVVALTAWNVSTYRRHARELADLQGKLGSYESRMAALDARERAAQRGIEAFDLKALEAQTSRANDVIALKAFSWTRLFNRLEEVLPYDVRMTTIRPALSIGGRSQETFVSNAEAGAVPVEVDGAAKTLDAFFEFEGALLMDPHFDRVEPERQDRAENEEIVFALRFLYYPEGNAPGDAQGAAAVAEAAAPARGSRP